MKDLIVVHAADTYPDMDIGAAEIKSWHVDGNGWSDIGYAYVIRRDGTVELGRDLDGDGDVEDETGAHAAGFNAKSIGICIVGGKSRVSNTSDANFTIMQYRSLIDLIDSIRLRHGAIKVIGHRDISPKDCPCFDVNALMDEDNE